MTKEEDRTQRRRASGRINDAWLFAKQCRTVTNSLCSIASTSGEIIHLLNTVYAQRGALFQLRNVSWNLIIIATVALWGTITFVTKRQSSTMDLFSHTREGTEEEKEIIQIDFLKTWEPVWCHGYLVEPLCSVPRPVISLGAYLWGMCSSNNIGGKEVHSCVQTWLQLLKNIHLPQRSQGP